MGGFTTRGPESSFEVGHARASEPQPRERSPETEAARAKTIAENLGRQYLSYDARNADLLFQVVSRRYERKSLVLTTNLAFTDWPTIFPNAACTTALIDRVVHHAEIIAIEGESYRRREAQAEKPPRRPKPKV